MRTLFWIFFSFYIQKKCLYAYLLFKVETFGKYLTFFIKEMTININNNQWYVNKIM